MIVTRFSINIVHYVEYVTLQVKKIHYLNIVLYKLCSLRLKKKDTLLEEQVISVTLTHSLYFLL
jgi:hypothetical protein